MFLLRMITLFFRCVTYTAPPFFKKQSKNTLSVCVLNHFSHVRLFAALWAVAFQASLFMGFSGQEYWSGLPCPPLGYLPNPGIETASLISSTLAGGFFTTSATWEDLDAGKDWGQEKKGATEDEMVEWHHQLNWHEFEQTPGDRGGQGSLACCSLRGHKESDTT